MRTTKGLGECERHFRVRLLQRYGIALRDRYSELNRRIRDGDATFIAKESGTRTHWDIAIDGQPVRVVYNRKLSALVTALPRPAAQYVPAAPSNGSAGAAAGGEP